MPRSGPTGSGRRPPRGSSRPRRPGSCNKLALGKPVAEIARELGLAPRAVEIHVGRILRVTGAASPSEVVARLSAAGASGNPAFARAPGGSNRGMEPAFAPQRLLNREA